MLHPRAGPAERTPPCRAKPFPFVLDVAIARLLVQHHPGSSKVLTTVSRALDHVSRHRAGQAQCRPGRSRMACVRRVGFVAGHEPMPHLRRAPQPD